MSPQLIRFFFIVTSIVYGETHVSDRVKITDLLLAESAVADLKEGRMGVGVEQQRADVDVLAAEWRVPWSVVEPSLHQGGAGTAL